MIHRQQILVSILILPLFHIILSFLDWPMAILSFCQSDDLNWPISDNSGRSEIHNFSLSGFSRSNAKTYQPIITVRLTLILDYLFGKRNPSQDLQKNVLIWSNQIRKKWHRRFHLYKTTSNFLHLINMLIWLNNKP